MCLPRPFSGTYGPIDESSVRKICSLEESLRLFRARGASFSQYMNSSEPMNIPGSSSHSYNTHGVSHSFPSHSRRHKDYKSMDARRPTLSGIPESPPQTPPKYNNDSRRYSLGDLVRSQKRQIIINLSQFFVIGGLYAFEVYCTNFVSMRIYAGDPLAPIGTPAHNNFLVGVKMGTAGVLTYYICFTMSTFLVGIVLPYIGTSRLMKLAVFGQVVICLSLALACHLWLYFLASVWMGFFRAVINTVPFILANQISRETANGEPTSGVAIAVVSSMLPCAFALCSAIMGPLIHATHAGAPIFYSAASGLLGLFTFSFLQVTTPV